MLHTVNKSSSEKSTLVSCLRLAADDADILLIEDAVYAAMTGTQTESIIQSALATYQIYVLEPDLECRGLDKSRLISGCLLYTSPSPRDRTRSRMPSSA